MAGLQVRGDINQDSVLNIADAVGLLRSLVGPADLPCQNSQGNEELLDTNGDGFADFSDAVHILSYLFLEQEPLNLGPECVPITHCPEACANGA